ncbi:MAG: hypothetical protein ACRD15_07550, partial [Vicinamibacterales bacterium]
MKSAVRAIHHDSSGGPEKDLIFRRHQVGSPQEYSTRTIGPALFRAAFQHLLKRILQILPVALAVLVQDDEIEREPFPTKVLVRFQQIAEKRELDGVSNLRQYDGNVARDSVLPQFRLAASIGVYRLGRSQTRIAVHESSAETLKPHRVVDGQPEVPQLDL